MTDITIQYGNITEEYESPATLETAGKLMSNNLILTASGGATCDCIFRLEFETLEFYTRQGNDWVDSGEMLWKIKDLPGLLTAIESGSIITMNRVEHYDASSNIDFTYDFNPATQIQKWKLIYVGANFSNYRPGSLAEDSSGSGTSHYLFEQTWESSDIVDGYILEPEIIIFDWLGSDEIHIDPSTGLVLYNLNNWIGG